MSTIRITAFPRVPSFARGLVRDIRVRWALEEAGLHYEERLLGADYKTSGDYRRMQPFGQVPVYEEEGLVLFESGAIVLHIAEKSPILLPDDPRRGARVKTWMFAALNTVEPPINNLLLIDFFQAGEEWAKLRRPDEVQTIRARLKSLARCLDGRDYLEGQFSAADLLMTTVLRALRHTDLVVQMPELEKYQRRCEARPAFQKALADQLSAYAGTASPEAEGDVTTDPEQSR